jgi:hypothetical protein
MLKSRICARLRTAIYPYLESAHPTILTDIATKKALDDD